MSDQAAAGAVATTRAEQAAITRAKLVNATIEALIEHGYAAASTTVICARAGVSRGAQIHHFPTKLALIGDAIDELARRMGRRLRREARRADRSDRVAAAIDLLWSGFSSPEAEAFLELWSAARHDQDLATLLRPTRIRMEQAAIDEIQSALGFADDGRDSEAVFRATLTMMQGLLARRLPQDEAGNNHHGVVLEDWKRLARLLLA